MTGGAIEVCWKTSAGSPETAEPSPGRWMTRSAYDSSDRGEHVLGRRRIERRRWLVEDQHPRMTGQRGADRNPLLLATREVVQRPTPKIGDPEQVESLLDALAHDIRCQSQLLHRVRQLVLDGVGDEAGKRVLADDADDV
jgi:hypothetical protein